ncbi:MAG: tryptophan 2,3-dioxygenase [Proteobacteria bacterium]|nr:tryptophan 2,3-dioxygenase [Pseudomonadota bacterium]
MRKPVYYGEYLQLDKLLDCQQRESFSAGKPAHDEMLFIIVHQAYELWFKQILFELDAVMDIFRKSHVSESAVAQAVAHLTRVEEIQKLLIHQIDVLETMTPLDFLDFRDFLVPASGFQSWQFRLIETTLGLKQEKRVTFGNMSYLERLQGADRERLELAETRPSLFDLLEKWLERTPFLSFKSFEFWDSYRQAVTNMLDGDRDLIASNPTLSSEERQKQIDMLERTRAEFAVLFDPAAHAKLQSEGAWRLSHKALQAALLIQLYRDQPILHMPYKLLSLLMDIDENFTTWRYRHSLMVLRMIGSKIGTGGSSGHDYLRQTARTHKVFGDLFAMSTFFIPRSDLPSLPADIEESLNFHYTATHKKAV